MDYKVPVIIKEAYTVYYENYRGSTFIHCDVRRWNKAVRVEMLKDWETLCLLHNEPIFASHTVGDKKHLKFLQMLNFKPVMFYTGNDLKMKQIFKKDN